jgi:hypothetical protein
MRLGRRGVLRGGVTLLPFLGGCVAGRADDDEAVTRERTPDSRATPTSRRTATRAETATPSRQQTEAVDRGPPVDERDTDTDGASAARQDTATETETATATATPAPNRALTERTRNVVEEIAWFGTQYPTAMKRMQRAMATIEKEAKRYHETKSNVTVPQARTLRRFVEEQVAVVEDALAPHFGLHNRIRKRTESHTGTILRFARRGDTDRVHEELVRLANYANGFKTDLFVEESLPRQPITNILIRYSRAGPYDPDAPLLFQVRDVDSGFDAYGYETHPEGSSQYTLYRPAVSAADERHVLRAYEPIRVSRNRTRETIVSFTQGVPERPRPFGSFAPEVGLDRTVYVQRYSSDRAARAAATLALGRVGVDEFSDQPSVVGDSQWSRVFYQYDGDVLYTYLTRAGPFILTTGATRTAWEERVGWGRTHLRTWLAGK